MRPEDIRSRLRVAPFAPFRIRLSNGATYPVMHPDQVWVGRSSVLIGTTPPGVSPEFFDEYTQVSILHVAEFLPMMGATPAPPGPTNGTPPAG